MVLAAESLLVGWIDFFCVGSDVVRSCCWLRCCCELIGTHTCVMFWSERRLGPPCRCDLCVVYHRHCPGVMSIQNGLLHVGRGCCLLSVRVKVVRFRRRGSSWLLRGSWL